MKAYVLAALCAAVTGLLLASRMRVGDPTCGANYGMDSIAATVIGGTSLAGGTGLLSGTVAGAFLIGMLSNVMNNLNVKFKSYSDLYFNTLFLCRSCSFVEKKEEIRQNILLLLSTYENEFENSTIQFSKIAETIQKEYSSPDFSISVLADTFHVSIAYMSYLFKKGFDVNFSDYLWNIRMKKAEELLSETDMNIDQISIQVGYLNTSSFRRKFKQETGLTPSQYRSKH